jgi:hypothetical protein
MGARPARLVLTFFPVVTVRGGRRPNSRDADNRECSSVICWNLFNLEGLNFVSDRLRKHGNVALRIGT